MRQQRALELAPCAELQFSMGRFSRDFRTRRLKIGGTFGGTPLSPVHSGSRFCIQNEEFRLICRTPDSVDVSHFAADPTRLGAVPSACFFRISPLVCRATVFTSSLPTQYCSVPSVTSTSHALPA